MTDWISPQTLIRVGTLMNLLIHIIRRPLWTYSERDRISDLYEESSVYPKYDMVYVNNVTASIIELFALLFTSTGVYIELFQRDLLNEKALALANVRRNSVKYFSVPCIFLKSIDAIGGLISMGVQHKPIHLFSPIEALIFISLEPAWVSTLYVTIVNSLKYFVSLVFILAAILASWAIFGLVAIDEKQIHLPEHDPPLIHYFTSFSGSYWTMLTVMNAANWPTPMIPSLMHNRLYFFFFMTFVVLVEWGFLNLILGLIVSAFESTWEETKKEAEKGLSLKQKRRSFKFKSLDPNSNKSDTTNHESIKSDSTNQIGDDVISPLQLAVTDSVEKRKEGFQSDEKNGIDSYTKDTLAFARRPTQKPDQGDESTFLSYIEYVEVSVKTKYYKLLSDAFFFVIGWLFCITDEPRDFLTVYLVLKGTEVALSLVSKDFASFKEKFRHKRYLANLLLYMIMFCACMSFFYQCGHDYPYRSDYCDNQRILNKDMSPLMPASLINAIVTIRLCIVIRLFFLFSHWTRSYLPDAYMHEYDRFYAILMEAVEPMWYLIEAILVFIYIYASIGMIIYGGVINRNPLYDKYDQLRGSNYGTQGYWPLNFNDMPSGLLTIFTLLYVNNMQITASGYVAVTNKWAQLFFGVFYVFGVLFFMNIVTAFIWSRVSKILDKNIQLIKIGKNEYMLTEEGDNIDQIVNMHDLENTTLNKVKTITTVSSLTNSVEVMTVPEHGAMMSTKNELSEEIQHPSNLQTLYDNDKKMERDMSILEQEAMYQQYSVYRESYKERQHPNSFVNSTGTNSFSGANTSTNKVTNILEDDDSKDHDSYDSYDESDENGNKSTFPEDSSNSHSDGNDDSNADNAMARTISMELEAKDVFPRLMSREDSLTDLSALAAKDTSFVGSLLKMQDAASGDRLRESINSQTESGKESTSGKVNSSGRRSRNSSFSGLLNMLTGTGETSPGSNKNNAALEMTERSSTMKRESTSPSDQYQVNGNIRRSFGDSFDEDMFRPAGTPSVKKSEKGNGAAELEDPHKRKAEERRTAMKKWLKGEVEDGTTAPERAGVLLQYARRGEIHTLFTTPQALHFFRLRCSLAYPLLYASWCLTINRLFMKPIWMYVSKQYVRGDDTFLTTLDGYYMSPATLCGTKFPLLSLLLCGLIFEVIYKMDGHKRVFHFGTSYLVRYALTITTLVHMIYLILAASGSDHALIVDWYLSFLSIIYIFWFDRYALRKITVVFGVLPKLSALLVIIACFIVVITIIAIFTFNLFSLDVDLKEVNQDDDDDYSGKYFESYGMSIWSVFVATTSSSYPNQVMPALQAYPQFAIFVIFFISVGAFFMLDSTLATVNYAFQQGLHSKELHEKKLKKELIRGAFFILAEATELKNKENSHVDEIPSRENSLVNKSSGNPISSNNSNHVKTEEGIVRERVLSIESVGSERESGISEKPNKSLASKIARHTDAKQLQMLTQKNKENQQRDVLHTHLVSGQNLSMLFREIFTHYSDFRKAGIPNHYQRVLMINTLDLDGDGLISRTDFRYILDVCRLRIKKVNDDYMTPEEKLIKKMHQEKYTPEEDLLPLWKRLYRKAKRFRRQANLWMMEKIKMCGKTMRKPYWDVLSDSIAGILIILNVLAQRELDGLNQLHFQSTIALLFYFLFELIFKWLMMGFKIYIRELRNKIDLLVFLVYFFIVLIGASANDLFYDGGIENQTKYAKGLEIVVMIRLLLFARNIACFANPVPGISWSNVIANIGKLVFTFSEGFICIGFTYAQLGCTIFGGDIKKAGEIPALDESQFGVNYFYVLNFNDMPTSFITLFSALRVSDFDVITSGFVAVTSKAARLFFAAWYVIGHLLMYNIILSYFVSVFRVRKSAKTKIDAQRKPKTEEEKIEEYQRYSIAYAEKKAHEEESMTLEERMSKNRNTHVEGPLKAIVDDSVLNPMQYRANLAMVERLSMIDDDPSSQFSRVEYNIAKEARLSTSSQVDSGRASKTRRPSKTKQNNSSVVESSSAKRDSHIPGSRKESDDDDNDHKEKDEVNEMEIQSDQEGKAKRKTMTVEEIGDINISEVRRSMRDLYIAVQLAHLDLENMDQDFVEEFLEKKNGVGGFILDLAAISRSEHFIKPCTGDNNSGEDVVDDEGGASYDFDGENMLKYTYVVTLPYSKDMDPLARLKVLKRLELLSQYAMKSDAK